MKWSKILHAGKVTLAFNNTTLTFYSTAFVVNYLTYLVYNTA